MSNEWLLVRARAALLLAVLGLVVHLVHHFQEGRSVGARRRVASVVGNDHSDLSVGGLSARAALRSLRQLASSLLALELALGAGAVGGLGALVVAIEFLADRAALGLGSLASSVALSGLANGFALGATVLLAQLLGASNRANRLGAVNGALGASHLLALHLALGTSANGVANSRAGGVIALPLALGVALGGRSHGGEQQNGENDEFHL